MSEIQEKLTNKSAIDRLVSIYREVALLTEDSKQIIADAKEVGLDYSTINKVAKAIALDKLDQVEETYQKFIDLAEEVA